MYNRYIPDGAGGFHCTVVQPQSDVPAKQEAAQHQTVMRAPEQKWSLPGALLPADLDSGDLLVLLVLVLILLDSDERDRLSVLLMIAAFLFL